MTAVTGCLFSFFFFQPSIVYQMQRRQPTRDTGQQGQHKYQYNTASLLLLMNNQQVTWRWVKQILNIQYHDSTEQTEWKWTGVALCKKSIWNITAVGKNLISSKIAMYFLIFFMENVNFPTFTKGWGWKRFYLLNLIYWFWCKMIIS